MTTRAFDLNIEEVLENWEVEHAIREVIANALDEQTISKTSEIQIAKDKQGDWHIRDFGRGLRIENFTLRTYL
jgi:DNA gyrase/topoisomerase IV subunit B